MLCLYCMLEFKLCCEILLLDMVCLMAHWVVFYVEGCGMSSAEYHVHLVGVNRLVGIVGKMAKDVAMV